MSIPRFAFRWLCALAALGCQAAGAPAPAPVESGAFVIRLGNDTVAAESYQRTGDRIEGVVVRRVPRTVVLRYVLTLNPSGSASQLTYNNRLADGSMLPTQARSVTVTFTGDSAITQIQRDSLVTRRVAARDAYPELDDVVSFYALPIAALTATNRDSATFRAYPPGAQATEAAPVVRRGPNFYWLYSFGNPIEVTTDDRGRVMAVDGKRTTSRIQTRRQPAFDIAALATAFAQRERQVGPIGALSLRDTVNAAVGGAQLWLDYGRPAARGRTIFGPNGVLGDTLWRTGANQETKFRTDVPLSLAGQTLAPGTYSLMTLAVPGRYHLIFYDAGREVMRAPLQTAPLSPSVERFTIVIEPAGGNAGAIRLRWDTMQLSLPFTVGSQQQR